MPDLDPVCNKIREVLRSEKSGLKYNDLIKRVQEKYGPTQSVSKGTINNHIKKDLEPMGYLVKDFPPTKTGVRKLVYLWTENPGSSVSFRPTFHINRVRVELTLSKVVHHTMTYEMANQNPLPQKSFALSIFGDVPRDWKQINPRIIQKYKGDEKVLYDKHKEPIWIRNDPYTKRFKIEFANPIYANEEVTLTFDYDWDEPKRYWEYDTTYSPASLELVLTSPKNNIHQAFVYQTESRIGNEELSAIPVQRKSRGSMESFYWKTERPAQASSFKMTWN